MKSLPEPMLRDITRLLVDEFHPEQVILFGSHAWGTPDEDSDVDLMVIVGESAETPARRAMRGYQCLFEVAAPTDILVKTRAEIERYRSVYASLEAEVMERGRVLYG